MEPETTPDLPARLCATCAAGMASDQDWCLECGTAAPGRLGGLRPGWRAVTTTLALTMVLVGGAGAASYAALSSDANREALATAPTDGAPVDQAPPAVPAPAAPVAPAPEADVEAPATDLPEAPAATPVAPTDTSTLAQVTPPAVDTTPGTTPPKTETETRSNATAAGPRGAGTNGDGDTGGADEPAEPLAFDGSAVALYDPYGRARDPGSPADVADGDTKTTFTVGAPDDDRDMQVGVVVDLGEVQQVRGVEFTTSTPGGDVEVYASDSSTLPPDILDTRWDHPASRKGTGEVERALFPRGGAEYRYVTLWFTVAPEDGPTFGLSELDVLG